MSDELHRQTMLARRAVVAAKAQTSLVMTPEEYWVMKTTIDSSPGFWDGLLTIWAEQCHLTLPYVGPPVEVVVEKRSANTLLPLKFGAEPVDDSDIGIQIGNVRFTRCQDCDTVQYVEYSGGRITANCPNQHLVGARMLEGADLDRIVNEKFDG